MQSSGLANKIPFEHAKSLANTAKTSGKQVKFQKTPNIFEVTEQIPAFRRNCPLNDAAAVDQSTDKKYAIASGSLGRKLS